MGTQERKTAEKQFRRGQILDAARTLLLSSGMDSISISAISNRAELGVGTIYFYFRNKEEIFAALQEEGLALLYADILKISQQDLSPEEQLKAIAAVYYRFSEAQKNYFDIINYFLSSPTVFFEAELKNQIDMSGHKILGIIRDIVRNGVEQRVFIEPDPGKFSILFFGTLHGLLQLKKLEKTILENENHMEIYAYSVGKLMDSIKT